MILPGVKALSLIIRDWVMGTVLRYESEALVARFNNGLLSQLDRGITNNPAIWEGGSTFQHLVPGQKLLAVDPNCHCFDPTTTMMLNLNAFTDREAGSS